MEKAKEELENVILSREGNVATITLNRPQALNAVSPGLIRDLTEAVRKVAKDENIRAVILTGAGRSFCAGGDIDEDVSQVCKMKPDEYIKYVKWFYEPFKGIVGMEKPVIAAIRGHAIGGGLDLAVACDIRIASQGARLGNAYVRMGIVPELGQSYFLPRLVGIGRAKLLTFTGDFITAEEAERIGLVEKVVPEEELDKTARDLAERLAKGPTKTIAMTKMAINKSLSMDFESSSDYCWRLNLSLLQTEDHHEAFTAFLEKRQPTFKGF